MVMVGGCAFAVVESGRFCGYWIGIPVEDAYITIGMLVIANWI